MQPEGLPEGVDLPPFAVLMRSWSLCLLSAVPPDAERCRSEFECWMRALLDVALEGWVEDQGEGPPPLPEVLLGV
jgi:hypothetical protein